MIKLIRTIANSRTFTVAPLNLQEFASLGIFAGDATKAFAEWKERNGFAELSDFEADDIEVMFLPSANLNWEGIEFNVRGREWTYASHEWIGGYTQVVKV